MSVLHPIGKPCPIRGKPMKRVRSEATEHREVYVCPRCEKDPLHNRAAQNWAASPLKPPTES